MLRVKWVLLLHRRCKVLHRRRILLLLLLRRRPIPMVWRDELLR